MTVCNSIYYSPSYYLVARLTVLVNYFRAVVSPRDCFKTIRLNPQGGQKRPSFFVPLHRHRAGAGQARPRAGRVPRATEGELAVPLLPKRALTLAQELLTRGVQAIKVDWPR